MFLLSLFYMRRGQTTIALPTVSASFCCVQGNLFFSPQVMGAHSEDSINNVNSNSSFTSPFCRRHGFLPPAVNQETRSHVTNVYKGAAGFSKRLLVRDTSVPRLHQSTPGIPAQ
ncbi:hypothetical protein B0T09DRAFT_326446 [Sordaria sp. MPI-SDFR-AT-0083]|nr:hypothetical protein B0T09DRAFT_326446 [Sordaria sp. MPI-SDFR-AT-0083]